MTKTLIGLLIGTAAEVAGLTWWRSLAADGYGRAAVGCLVGGGAVGWLLTAALVRNSLASHPRRAGTTDRALALLGGLAAVKVGLWVGWASLVGPCGLTVATILLAAALHVKHAIAVAAVAGRPFWPTFGDPVTVAATAAAAGGPAVWVALLQAEQPGGAAAALFAFLAAENALQFLAGGLFDPPVNAQSAFTVVTEVEDAAVEGLRSYLRPIGADRAAVARLFAPYDRLHFCSLVLLDQGGPPTLVFEGNVDGAPLSFLHDLARRSPAFLTSVYSGCVGYPAEGDPAAVADYLADHDSGATALYVGMPGETLEQIRRDAQLRDAVETELDDRHDDYVRSTPKECRTRLQKFVNGQPGLGWTNLPVARLARVEYGPRILAAVAVAGLVAGAAVAVALAAVDGVAEVGVAVVVAVAATALGLVGYLVWLRRRESRDVQISAAPPAELLTGLQLQEDLQLQNHLVSVSVVKPGWLRLITLRAVLVAINLAARYVATKGNLGGIVTIHFARWVVLAPRGRPPRLLFLSNYDGSWENYLGEFIDRASLGLTAVWSNTGLGPDRGFPDTRWLFLRGGSRDEQRFKSIVRLSQRTADVWYSAYPELSVKQIAQNRAFRAGLFGRGVDAAAWLRLV